MNKLFNVVLIMVYYVIKMDKYYNVNIIIY